MKIDNMAALSWIYFFLLNMPKIFTNKNTTKNNITTPDMKLIKDTSLLPCSISININGILLDKFIAYALKEIRVIIKINIYFFIN